ncbi:MAG: ABC transporter permease [Terriglobia bacterium]
MEWLIQFGRRLQMLVRQKQFDSELEEELRLHRELREREQMEAGVTPEEARYAAQRRFGNDLVLREESRDMWGWSWLENTLQDVRYGLRILVKNPGFTTVAVLTLGLGIGANIAVFSVVNTILLRPLPFRAPQQLTWLAGNNGEGGLSDQTYRVDVLEEIQRHSQSFQEMTAYVPYYDYSDFKLTGFGEPKPVFGVWVAGNFFQTLGIQPALGRLFTHEECVKGGRPAVLLTEAFWQRQFAGNPAIIGQAITLNKRTYTIVGVLPDSFDFTSVFAPGLKMDFFVPIIMDDIRTYGHMLSLMGRLKPGVTVGQAQAEVTLLLSQSKAQNPDWMTDIKTTITGLKDYVSGKLRRSLIVLWCAVGLILLIVCVNLSNLLLTRAAARSKEFAMRSALGAGRGRLIRQLLTESLVLSCAGTILGLGFAFAVTRYLAHQGSIALPLLSSVRVDEAALNWTLLVAAAASVLFSLVPGLRISGVNLQESLKDAGSGMSAGRKHERMRAALVVSEVALACVLLVGAGLLLRSFLRILDVDLGFQPSRAAAIKVDYDDGGNRARRGAILQEILQRAGAIPGVESVGMSDKLPLDRNRSWDLRAKGRVYPPGVNDDAFVYVVTPGYFGAMGTHLREGRDFNWQDTNKSEPVIIINQTAARRDWPGEDPVGRLAQGIGETDTRVIGVVADVRESSVEEHSSPEVYVPATQAEPDGENLVVRTNLPPEALASVVLRTLRELNPGQPATEFRPLQRIVDHAVSPRRFFVVLVACFAALGLVLASLGIYGVISYSVTQRTREIGIRMAFGATASQVQFGVIAETLRLALIGIAVGTLASFVAARWIASLLFGTAPTDPITFVGIILLLSAVGFIAGYIPARRATKVDPLVALRYQ